MDDFKKLLLSDINKHLMIEYPHFITKQFVKKLTMLLNYMASALIVRNNRNNRPGWNVNVNAANIWARPGGQGEWDFFYFYFRNLMLVNLFLQFLQIAFLYSKDFQLRNRQR